MTAIAIGFERGEKSGRVKGREEVEAQVVRRLLGRFGVPEVSELLGLTPQDVERIAAKENDKKDMQ